MLEDAMDLSYWLGLDQLTNVLGDLALYVSDETGYFNAYEVVDIYEGVDVYEYMRYFLDSDESVYSDSDFYDLSDYLS